MAVTRMNKLVHLIYVGEPNKKGHSSNQEDSAKTLTITPNTVIPNLNQPNQITATLIIPLLLQVAKPNKIHTPWTADQSTIQHIKSTARQQEEHRREDLTMQKKDSNSNNNMKARRKLNCAETLKCMVNANSETPAHMLMVPTNYKRKHIFQATSWPSYALNSTKMVSACMVKDANSYTVSMI